jgi:phage-related protein (TIGR01555 family)
VINVSKSKQQRPRVAVKATAAKRRADGWQNVLTGIGTDDRDKRRSSVVGVSALSYADCQDLYEGDDMAARVVDALPDDALRKGFSAQFADDPEQETTKTTAAALDTLDAEEKIRTWWKWSRAYGGAGILIGVNGPNEDLSVPLKPEQVREVTHLTVLDSSELVPNTLYADANAPKYGEPQTFLLQPAIITSAGVAGSRSARVGTPLQLATRVVHESRVLWLPGVIASRRHALQTLGRGDSTLVRVWEVIRDFQSGYDTAGSLLTDFSQAVMKLKGLAAIMASPNGKQLLTDRLAGIDMGRSVLRSIVIDKDDDFERKATPMTGLPETLDRFAQRLAAAADMPVTRLLGEAPAGLNGTAEQDGEFWREKVEAGRKLLVPHLNKLLRILFAARMVAGEPGPTGGEEPDDWRVEFPPLRQLSEKEEAEVRFTQAQADHLYLQDSVLDPVEVAVSRFGGPGYSTETKLEEPDPDKRRVATQEQQQAELEAQQQLMASKAPPGDKQAPPKDKQGDK